MDQAIARAIGAMPSTTQPAAAPRLVGEFQGYVDGILPSVRWLDRKNMPQVGDRLFAIPAHAAVPRSWSILLTSANHGTVGPLGSTFPHAGEHHERVQVVVLVEAGTPPAPDVDLAGLVRLPLTDEQIAAGAAIECDHGAPIGRNAAIDVFDAMCAAAPVAAQAGQVAVPEGFVMMPKRLTAENGAKSLFMGEFKESIEVNCSDCEGTDEDYVCTTCDDTGVVSREVTIEWDTIKRIYDMAVEHLAAAPSAPAEAQQAPADWVSVDERLPEGRYCLATYRNRHGKLRVIRAKYARQYEIDAGEDAIDQGNCEYNEADDTFYLKAGWLECIDNWDDYSSIYVTEGEVTHWMPLPAAPAAQASTAGERQPEGGAA